MQNEFSAKRIEIIDVLRGFSLLGIIIAHFLDQYYGGAFPGKLEGLNKINLGILNVADILVSGKFFMIFSFLFGMSFFIQMSKKNDQKSGSKFFIWRLAILFLIGLIHALHYRADILGVYAFLGLFLLFFRSMPNRFLIMIGVLMAINLPTLGFRLMRAVIKPKTVSAEVRFIEPVEKVHNAYFDVLKNGTYSDMVKINGTEILPRMKYRLGSGKGFVIFGLFLIGLAVGKMGLFNSGASLKEHFRITGLGIILAFLVLAISYLLLEFSANSAPGSQQLSSIFLEFIKDAFSFVLAFTYVFIVCILFQKPRGRKLFMMFYSVGRMGLTTYLTQTVAGIIIFYGIGFGLLGVISPAVCLLLGVGVYAIQILFSNWWLHRFQYGIVEWSWRCLTLFKLFPLRK